MATADDTATIPAAITDHDLLARLNHAMAQIRACHLLLDDEEPDDALMILMDLRENISEMRDAVDHRGIANFQEANRG